MLLQVASGGRRKGWTLFGLGWDASCSIAAGDTFFAYTLSSLLLLLASYEFDVAVRKVDFQLCQAAFLYFSWLINETTNVNFGSMVGVNHRVFYGVKGETPTFPFIVKLHIKISSWFFFFLPNFNRFFVAII